MNNAIESIMSFINENTTLLICICIFLIVILVIYLIETSIRAKIYDKKLKVEKEKTDDLVLQHNIEIQKEKEMKETNQKFENAIVNEEIQKINVEATDLEDEKEEPVVIFPEKVIDEEKENDKNIDVVYKNDRKLSEILFGDIEKQPEGKLDDSILKKDEEIEELSSVEELDQIMQKLNNYQNDK